MKILFIYSIDSKFLPNGLLDLQERIQFGISYISSFLQKYGHQTELILMSRSFGRRNIVILSECLEIFQPGLICVTAVATEYDFVANIAKYIKHRHPHIYVLVGGVHVTLNPGEILSDDFDALCIGEGENPTLELVSQLEKGGVPHAIPNLWIKHGPDIEKNSPRGFLKELNSLPFPDRRMWQRWMKQKCPKRCSVLISRGCPFNCSYCCNHAIKDVSPGTYVRHRSPENIIAEIIQILTDSPTIEEIYFETETIITEKDWCIDLCAKLRDFNATLRQPLSFGANVRIVPNMHLEDILPSFRKANFRFVNVGLESGSERVRRKILRRNYSNNDVVSFVELARKHNLKVAFFNLIGIPGETLADFKETIEINRKCKPDWVLPSIFFPYPGSDLYFSCKKQGLLKENLDPRQERRIAILDLPGFPRKKIQESFDLFQYYVYYKFNIDDTLLICIFSILHKFYHKCLIRMPVIKYMLQPLKKLVRS